MTNTSIASELGIPEGFSVVLFTFGLALALAPWLAGEDFGFFKIPPFAGSTRRALKFIGPAAFAIVFTVHLPLLGSQSASRPDDPAPLPQQTTPRDHGRQEPDSLISELQQPNRQPVSTPFDRGLPITTDAPPLVDQQRPTRLPARVIVHPTRPDSRTATSPRVTYAFPTDVPEGTSAHAVLELALRRLNRDSLQHIDRIAAGDTDGDGDLEHVVVATLKRDTFPTYDLNVLLYDPSPSGWTLFELRPSDSLAVWEFLHELVLHDLDHDGATEVLVQEIGTGSGGYGELGIFKFDGRRYRQIEIVPPLNARFHFALDDLNGDGVDEVILSFPPRLVGDPWDVPDEVLYLRGWYYCTSEALPYCTDDQIR